MAAISWRRLMPSAQPGLAEQSMSVSLPVQRLEGSLCIRSVAKELRQRLEQLWADVLPTLSQMPMAPCDGSTYELFFASLAASQSFRDLWAGPNRGPFVLPRHGFVKQALSLRDVVHGLSMPLSRGRRKPCETALTLTDGRDFRCPISLPPIATVGELLQVLEYGTVFY